MSIRVRKFIGMIILVSFIMTYSIGIMALKVDGIGDMPKPIELIFYIFAGIIWIIPARHIMLWIQKDRS